MSMDEALNILEKKYGSNSLAFGDFIIQDGQVAKKIEHAVCFGITVEDFGFSQKQARQINYPGGIVEYLRLGNKLPSLDLIRTFQNNIKNFCESQYLSVRNDQSMFRGTPSITFFNEQTRQVVIFNRETKIFITAYKMSAEQGDRYIQSGKIGKTNYFD